MPSESVLFGSTPICRKRSTKSKCKSLLTITVHFFHTCCTQESLGCVGNKCPSQLTHRLSNHCIDVCTSFFNEIRQKFTSSCRPSMSDTRQVHGEDRSSKKQNGYTISCACRINCLRITVWLHMKSGPKMQYSRKERTN